MVERQMNKFQSDFVNLKVDLDQLKASDSQTKMDT
jgi:hypothetical protein